VNDLKLGISSSVTLDCGSQLTYRTTIREDAPVNSHVVQVEASDADAGEHAVLQYTLSGDSSEKFMVNSQTGKTFS